MAHLVNVCFCLFTLSRDTSSVYWVTLNYDDNKISELLTWIPDLVADYLDDLSDSSGLDYRSVVQDFSAQMAAFCGRLKYKPRKETWLLRYKFLGCSTARKNRYICVKPGTSICL